MIKRGDLRIRDPFVLAANGGYCLYGTCNLANSAEYGDGKTRGFSSFFSRDLENFEGPFHAFDRPTNFWAEKDFWAPEVFFVDGAYYMFATFFSEKAGRRCQVLRSLSPLEGFEPWSEPFTPKGWWCLDATLFFWNNKPYSIFCREWLQVGDGEMWIVELAPDLSAAAGEPRLIFRASDAPWTREFGEGNRVTDGPFVHTLASGKPILLWSSSGERGYAMGIASPSSADITDRWVQSETALYAEDGGHGMIFLRDGEPHISIHTPNSHDERAVFIKVRETADSVELA